MKRWSWVLLLFASPGFGWTLISPNIQGWATRPLPVYVNTAECSLSRETILDEVDRAIALWNSIPTSGLTLVRVPEEASITEVTFEDGSSTEVPAVICVADFSSINSAVDVIPALTSSMNLGSGPLTRSVVYLNSQPGAGAEIGQLDGEELRIALAHEMGHMLGLGHSASSGSLMFFSLGGKESARLTEDDRFGISYLYPRNELSDGPFGCARVRGGSARALPSALLWLSLLVAWGRRYRRRRQT